MKLHEYQAKELLARYGVSVPRGRVARSAAEAESAAAALGGGCVVKAQAHTGARGKAGASGWSPPLRRRERLRGSCWAPGW